MANKIIHKHSSVITDGKAKLPVASQLEYGELAINYAEGVETISMKNSANEIVEIKSTNYLEKIIIDNEFVTAKALVDLDERIEEIDSTFGDAISETNAKVAENELVTTHALTDLDDRLSNIEDAGYASESDLVPIREQISTINTKIEEKIGTINTVIEENEHITAASLNDLNKRLTNVETNGGNTGDLDTLIAEVEDNEYVTALAITELESRVLHLELTIAALQENLANVTAQLTNTSTTE